MTPSGAKKDYVLRDTGSLVVFWIAIAVLLYLLGDTVVKGDWPWFAFTLPLALLGAWLVWFVLAHPQVRYDSTRVLVVNIGRIHELPWPRVRAVRQRLGMVFELDNGTTVTAAGASAPRGMGTIVSGITGRLATDGGDFSRNASSLDAMRDSAAPTDAAVVSRWDVRALAIGAVLALAVIIDIIVAVAIASA